MKHDIYPTQMPDLPALCSECVIEDWTTENVLWPGLTLLLAGLMYTFIHIPVTNSFYVGGELIGAGGPLLTVVMAASVATKIKVVQAKLPPVSTCLPPDSTVTASRVHGLVNDINQLGKRISLLQGLGMGAAVICAGQHVLVEHVLHGGYRVGASCGMLLANVFLIFASASLFRARHLVLKTTLIELSAVLHDVPTATIQTWRVKTSVSSNMRMSNGA